MVCAYRARIYPAHRPFLFLAELLLSEGIIRRRSCRQALYLGPTNQVGVGLPEAGPEISTGMRRPRTTGQLAKNAGEYWRADGESGWNQSGVVLVLFREGIRKRCTLEPRLGAGQAQQEAGHGQAFPSSEGGSEATNDPKRRTKIRHNKTVSCAMMVAWSSERREQGIEADAVPHAPVVHN